MAATTKEKTSSLVEVFEDVTRINPDAVAKFVKEFGENTEKLRSLLNVLIVPGFKPTFERTSDYAGAAVEFLGVSDPEPDQSPYRMFDVNTGNLIEFPSLGVHGQYAILSHRWKGTEVTLSHIQRARTLDRDRRRAENGDGGVGNNLCKNDVDLVLEQCKLDILEQENIVKELARDIPSEQRDVRALLIGRFQIKGKEWGLETAKKAVDQAISKLNFARMEQKVISDLIVEMIKGIDDSDEKVKKNKTLPKSTDGQGQDAGNEESRDTPEAFARVGGAVMEAEQGVEKAKDDLKTTEKEFKTDTIDSYETIFKDNARLREAVDEMISRLQLWKSAIKLQRATLLSKGIFENEFPQGEKRNYLWLDTSCIDKQNAGEYAVSIALMGDWYAKAEFCLVQLDKKFKESDAALDWDRFQVEGRTADHPPVSHEPNFREWEKVPSEQFEWAERGWTLQELVMSKSTFFANSEWDLLSRPVETLGRYYYLVPYIAQYIRSDSQNPYTKRLNEHPGTLPTSALLDHQILEHREETCDVRGLFHTDPQAGEEARIKTAHRLIQVLEELGVRIPMDVVMETATSEIAQAVYFAAADLASKSNLDSSSAHANVKVLRELRAYLNQNASETTEKDMSFDEKEAQHLINLLLWRLVAETKDLIISDRQRVAELGRVDQLERWQEGIQRWGFSTEKIMDLSCKRKVTVAVDHVYSLMGVLGVRFQTFHAEGFCKALSRLLDEVVITHNDVSVFNWTGMEMGSPIRGRSMYPSSHKAYKADEDRGQRSNMVLSLKIKDKLAEITTTYDGIIFILRAITKHVKEKGGSQVLPFHWLDPLVNIIKSSTFDHLQPGLDTLSKIVGYILSKWTPPLPPAKSRRDKETKVAEEEATSPETPDSPLSPLNFRPSLREFGLPSTKKKETESKAKFGVPTRLPSLGKGLISRPSFGKKSTEEQIPQPIQPGSGSPHDKAVEPPQDSSKGPPPLSPEAQKSFDENVMHCIQQLGNTTQGDSNNRATLTDEFNDTGLKLPKSTAFNTPDNGVDEPGRNMISPHPIIVNSSGIEGIFDIQRVIITMVDMDNLRRKVANAASPQEKISGWCHISTGFARVVTNFACQKHILEKELDVVATVESKVLKEQENDSSQKRRDKLKDGLALTLGRSSKDQKSGSNLEGKEKGADGKEGTEKEKATDGEEGAGQAGEGQGAEGGTEGGFRKRTDGTTEEEKTVSRMIGFIQETDLNLVAGEWVLARLSGTPGAKWFLCHLELGSTHQFYGHRIPTGALDFRNATPEPGLVNAWRTYMDRKKRKMCKILEKYLDSKQIGHAGEERRKEGAETFLGLLGMPSSSSPAEDGGAAETKPPDMEFEEISDVLESGESESEGEEDDERPAGGSAMVLEKGKYGARAFFDFGISAVVEKILEKHADHLEKHLSMSVLKRTPKCLRTAVENINDNKNFLPSMFHSATRIHMF